MSALAPGPASAWMRLRVTAKVRESAVITSLHLAPEDPAQWRPYRPGQFLVLRLTPAGRAEPVLRHYSLSGPPGQTGQYRISVKREDLGLGSTQLHDHVQVGDLLDAQGPRGTFTLDEQSARAVLLLSGGVGLTPLVSMLHALSATERRVFFVHACDNASVHALRAEVDALAACRPGLRAHYLYRRGTPADLRDGRCHGTGLLDYATLQALLPLDDYDVYLCGPAAFMQTSHALLRGLGVARERIAYESFGPATVLADHTAPATRTEARPEAPPPPAEPPAMATAASPDAAVRFAASGLQRDWQEGCANLLDFAESCGLEPAFSCRAGVCGSCQTPLLSGQVRYVEEPLQPPSDGAVLLCCAVPQGPVTLDL